MKTAILQVADTGPLDSLIVMLRSVGYQCALPSPRLQDELRRLGCDTVLSVQDLVREWGYERPITLPEAGVSDLSRSDVIYVDVKAHRNGPIVWNKWPHLEKRTLWYRINGGRPEHVITKDGFDCGDEVNPPCPVLTPNLWYQHCPACSYGPHGQLDWGTTFYNTPNKLRDAPCTQCLGTGKDPRAYACWPPFYRFDEYGPRRHPVAQPTYVGTTRSEVGPSHTSHPPTTHSTFSQGRFGGYEEPMCLIHNLYGWGYGALAEGVRALGVRLYGRSSPDGLINHKEVPGKLSRTLAYVHLKSSDAPGYALYEALSAGCPIVCTRRLIWRNRMQELLIPGETCLVFDRETHDGLSEEDVHQCLEELTWALEVLKDPAHNARLGYSGRARLGRLMWNESRAEDVNSLRDFMERNFP